MSKNKRPKQKETDESADMQRYLEWQEKQYLPGYYVGGRIPPIFYGKRPNKYGYLLLATGSLTLIGLLWGIGTNLANNRDMTLVGPTLIAVAIGLLQIVAGWRLLQKRNKRN
ncbi:MAG: hypothetical protein U0350_03595 [Caldilineaceae bacterium]